MEYQKYTDITEDQNRKWEAMYGKSRIMDLQIEIDDDRIYNFVVRKPDRSIIKAIGNYAAKNDVEKVNEVLIKNCVLGGDMEALEKDGGVYLKVLENVNLLNQKAKSTLKKR